MNDVMSEMLMVTNGVHQGSIIGHLLFLIYVNDIVNTSNLFKFLIYGYDTTLSTTIKVILKNIIPNSKYFIFHMPQKRINQLGINIENIAIDRISDLHFLALTINGHLNWKSHTDRLSNEISKTMGVLIKLKHFVPLNTRVMIYKSLILSLLIYSILAWGYRCERITKLQKHIIRILSTMPILNQYLKY